MNTIEFRVAPEDLDGLIKLTVTAYVDGVSLVELARRVELGPATAHGEAGVAGGYAGLVVGTRDWRRWFSGVAPLRSWADGSTCVLTCPCGEIGCWPLRCRITVGEQTVDWTDFQMDHRAWDISALGPLRFDRRAYERALNEPVFA